MRVIVCLCTDTVRICANAMRVCAAPLPVRRSAAQLRMLRSVGQCNQRNDLLQPRMLLSLRCTARHDLMAAPRPVSLSNADFARAESRASLLRRSDTQCALHRAAPAAVFVTLDASFAAGLRSAARSHCSAEGL